MGENTQNYTTLTDEELIVKINHDDRHAYAILLQRYAHKVVRMAVSVVKNEEEAQDVAQDVFLSLLVSLQDWDKGGKAKFSSWIYRITLNKAIDYKRKRKPVASTDDVQLPCQAKDGYQQILEKEISRNMKSLLEKLPDTQREAIFLYYYKDMNIPEIAQKMNSTDIAVRSLLKRGKAILRDKIRYEETLKADRVKELV
tara:strand:+ start:3651 stop:4247 length:597 start_codon:yes stop_codon:yes gene_type:complete